MALHLTKAPKKLKFVDIPLESCFVSANIDNPNFINYKINASQAVSISSNTGHISLSSFGDTEEFRLIKVTGIDVKAEEI